MGTNYSAFLMACCKVIVLLVPVFCCEDEPRITPIELIALGLCGIVETMQIPINKASTTIMRMVPMASSRLYLRSLPEDAVIGFP